VITPSASPIPNATNTIPRPIIILLPTAVSSISREHFRDTSSALIRGIAAAFLLVPRHFTFLHPRASPTRICSRTMSHRSISTITPPQTPQRGGRGGQGNHSQLTTIAEVSEDIDTVSDSDSDIDFTPPPTTRVGRIHPLSRRPRPPTVLLGGPTNDLDSNGDPVQFKYAWLDANGDPKDGGTEDGGITNGRNEIAGTRRGPRYVPVQAFRCVDVTQ
jgi:hypothetical protein